MLVPSGTPRCTIRETFLLPTWEERLLPENPARGDFAKPQRRIAIGRRESNVEFQVLPFSLFFFSLFFLPRLILPEIGRRRSKSTVTTQQRSTIVKIYCYRPTTTVDSRNRLLSVDYVW
ncbi:hypothetical protein BHE74_00029273 [Ensete ventricosum]|nr:hypothetical protein BHE74_00029273 [Ensete ventricosum]